LRRSHRAQPPRWLDEGHLMFLKIKRSGALDERPLLAVNGGMDRASPQLVSIQVLRAVAALVVTFAHLWPHFEVFGLGDRFPNFILGASGVDLFFVISGFIMVYASEPLFGRSGAPARFFIRRLIRILPLYWLATSAVLLTYLAVAPNLSLHNLTWTNVVASYLFVPLPRPDGTTAPVLGVGWTLNFEMFFYVVFAAAVALPRRAAVAAVTLFFIVAVNSPVALPSPFRDWFVSTIYEFAFGMGIALAFREGLRVPAWLSAVLIAVGVGLMIRTDWDGFATIGRVTGWGGGAAMIVAGCALADVRPATGRVWLALAFLGDASYALYLLHTFALRAVFPILAPTGRIWLCALVGMIAAIGSAIAAYLFLEKPIARFLKRGLGQQPVLEMNPATES
jgi:exopolysaccharide production protein ExoZ